MALLAGTRFFRPDEMVIAKEVLDEGIKAGPGGHYQSYVIETSGRIGRLGLLWPDTLHDRKL